MSASFVGTVLSPHVFNWGGYYALYIIRLVLVAVALVYWLRAVKSPKELGLKQEEDEDESKEKEEDKTGGDQNASISSRYGILKIVACCGKILSLYFYIATI